MLRALLRIGTSCLPCFVLAALLWAQHASGAEQRFITVASTTSTQIPGCSAHSAAVRDRDGNRGARNRRRHRAGGPASRARRLRCAAGSPPSFRGGVREGWLRRAAHRSDVQRFCSGRTVRRSGGDERTERHCCRPYSVLLRSALCSSREVTTAARTSWNRSFGKRQTSICAAPAAAGTGKRDRAWAPR